MARRSIMLDVTHSDLLNDLVGRSRSVTGAMEHFIDWLAESPDDVRAVLFDGVSPAAEADILERLADRARVRAGRPSFRDAARLILQHAAETGPSSVLREMSFDEMSTLTKTLAELMAERGKLLQRELGDKVKSAQKK